MWMLTVGPGLVIELFVRSQFMLIVPTSSNQISNEQQNDTFREVENSLASVKPRLFNWENKEKSLLMLEGDLTISEKPTLPFLVF